MPKRFYETELFEEDWFIDLPEHYKLFWLYIKAKCDPGGFWRVSKAGFRSMSQKIPMFDDFVKAVNRDDEGGDPVSRIIVVEKKTWFIPSYITDQCGHLFNPKVGAHRGAIRLLAVKKISLEKVPDFDWCGLEQHDYEEVRQLVLQKSWTTLSELLYYSKGIGTRIGNRNKEEGIVKGREKTGFQMQWIYDMPFPDYAKQGPAKLTEAGFDVWKQFVDWTIQGEFDELFECKYITPKDFQDLYDKGFTPDKWEGVIRKILSTGIMPQHNLYFRIPDFALYLKKGPKPKEAPPAPPQSSSNNSNFTGSV